MIWADADSLQPEIRQLLERRATQEVAQARRAVRPPRFRVTFVASKKLKFGPAVHFILVAPGPQAADTRIVGSARPGDLAITRDLPLAETLALAGIRVLNDRGELFTADTARERRSLRDQAAILRALGIAPASPRARTWGSDEFKKFADCLDRALATLPTAQPGQ
jgi:uncharacterized protein YaiI (UPF0178 family)